MPENMRIILARHGRTEWNGAARFQGKTDVPLTEEGRTQAGALARRLSSWPLEAVYTSPLSRAVYTAEAIAGAHELKPIVLPELREIDFGVWEGESIPDLDAKQHTQFTRWRADPFFNPPPKAETWPELSARLERAVKIILESGCSRVVVVSHGGIMRAIYAVFLGLNARKVWNMDVSNCAMSGIEMRYGRPCLVFENDDLHVRAGSAGESLPVWGESNAVKL